jgi:hypothetical protein
MDNHTWQVRLERLTSPTVFTLDGKGSFQRSALRENDSCPETHYQCPGDVAYCLPVFTRCNGYYDCLGGEDEVGCEDATCSGFYRCRGSPICVDPDHLCDGWPQCPQHDDEWLCGERPCPDGCLCQGLAFICHQPYPAHLYPNLRYLDIQAGGFDWRDQQEAVYLTYLKASRCDMAAIPLVHLPNLRTLDVSDNNISTLHLGHLAGFVTLNKLILKRNPLVSILAVATTPIPTNVRNYSRDLAGPAESEGVKVTDSPVSGLSVTVLDLSYTRLENLNSDDLLSLQRLEQLDLSHTPLRSIAVGGLRPLTQLHTLNLRGSRVEEYHWRSCLGWWSCRR